jgi:hypothetical protein
VSNEGFSSKQCLMEPEDNPKKKTEWKILKDWQWSWSRCLSAEEHCARKLALESLPRFDVETVEKRVAHHSSPMARRSKKTGSIAEDVGKTGCQL